MTTLIEACARTTWPTKPRTSRRLSARRRTETRIRMLREEAARLERALEGRRW